MTKLHCTPAETNLLNIMPGGTWDIKAEIKRLVTGHGQ